MADNNDNLGDVSKSSESLRARKINSLHRSVDDVVQQQNRRRIQASNQIKEAGLSSETEKSYNGILKSLGRTIEHLSTGVKKITVDTSKATSDAIGQYGRAVGEDISINKTNTVAMALSKSTPLFGYFAAKFMETDVFKDSANKIKQNIGSAMHAGISKASGAFTKSAKGAASYAGQKGASVEDLQSLKDTFSKSNQIPKLQSGGYVKEGGLAQLHAAEVVTPIDKLYKQFGQILELQKEQQSVMTTIFIKEFKRGRIVQSDDQHKLIKSFDEMKAGLIGSADRTRVAWQTTLLKHPTFRSMLLFKDILKQSFVSPVKWLFGLRGGYKGDVVTAMASSNVFLKQANLLGILYTGMMPKLDQIIQYTRAQAEAFIGEKIAPKKDYSTYTLFEKIKAKMTSRTLPGKSKTSIQKLVTKFGLDESSLKEAGFEKTLDFINPIKIFQMLGKGGINVKNIKGKIKDDDAFSKHREFYKFVTENLGKLTGYKKDQEEREGPHSPSMAQNIASTASVTIDEASENKSYRSKTFGLWFKIKKNSVMQSNYMKSMRTYLRKLKGRLWDIALLGFAFFKDMFFKGFGMFKSILTSLGMGGAGAAITGFGGKIAGGAKNLYSSAKGALGFGKAGAKGGMLKGAGKVAGRIAGGAVSGVIGSGMGMWDMFQAIRQGNATGFVGNFITRGIAGFLGGTDTGFKGSLHGATKGGALGTAIGAFGGPMGIAIGGAIGAISGGLMGFVGGKKISAGISESLKTLKGLIGGVWKLMKFPFQVFREATQIAWTLTKFGYNKTIGKLVTKFQDWWSQPGIIQKGLHWLTDKVLMIWDSIKKPFVWIADKLSGMFGDDLWTKIVESAKTTLYYVMFPLLAMKKAFKYIADKVKNIPFIGKALKGMGSFIGDVQSGELSKKVDIALNKPGPRLGENLNQPISVTKLPQDIKNQLNKEGAKDITTRESQTGGIILRDNIDKTIELKLEQKRNEELKKELEGIKDGTIKNGAVMMQNIQSVNSSTNSSSSNIVNNNGGNGRTSFSNAQILAAQIAQCNTM